MLKNNLLYFSGSSLPSTQANSVHVMRMCDALSQFYNVTLFAFKGKNYTNNTIANIYGVKNHFNIFFYIKYLGPFSKILILLKNIATIKVSVVYGRNLTSCFFASLLGLKTIFEAHYLIFEGNFYERVLFKLFIKTKGFSKLVLISHAQKRIYLNKFEELQSKIFVLHDGADINTCNGCQVVFNKQQSQFNYHIGYVGSLYKGRGIELIIDLARNFSNIAFHIVGGSENEILEFRNKSIDNLFFHGRINPSLVFCYLKKFDVLLAPYSKDVKVANNKLNTVDFMSPLKIFEYMSSNKAILVSDLKVIREVLDDDSAFFCEVDSLESWINQINIILKDPLLAKKRASNAHTKFFNNFTWQRRAEQIALFD